MVKCVFIFLVLTFMLSCNKEDTKKPAIKPINFHGIISTDNNGNIIYNNDSTDWKLNDTWSTTESGLFTTSKPICNNPFNYQVFGYPNPCNGYMSINYRQSQTVHFAFNIVDRYYKVLIADSLKSSSNLIDLSKYKGGDTLRVYYKIITSDCECRGHGDIVVK
jgi:hypothetical protein